MKISLTFDNGPTPGVTSEVLDILREERVPATFFVVGQNLAQPGACELMVKAKAEGHAIGNHTFSHSVVFGDEANQRRVLEEIDRTEAALGAFSADRLFRPYGGGGVIDHRLMSRTAFDHLRAGGFTLVLWNSIPEDWIDPVGWPEVAVDQARDLEWAVTVVHDLPTGAMGQLRRFIDLAREAGGEFVSGFPVSVTPLVLGHAVGSMDGMITEI